LFELSAGAEVEGSFARTLRFPAADGKRAKKEKVRAASGAHR